MRLCIPPMTVAMNAISSGAAPMSGSTEAERPTQKMATTPASSPLMMKVAEITRFAGTPIRRAVVNLSAAARIAMPSTVRFITNVSPTSSTTVEPMMMRFRTGIVAVPRVSVWEKNGGSGTARARGDMVISTTFCKKTLTANEVTSMAVSDLVRTGRKATSSVV